MVFLIVALLFFVTPQISFGSKDSREDQVVPHSHFHHTKQPVSIKIDDINTGKEKDLGNGFYTNQYASQLHTFSDKTETVVIDTEGRTDFNETINIELPNSVKTMTLSGEKIVGNKSINFLPRITKLSLENLIIRGDKDIGTIKKLLQNEGLRSFEFYAMDNLHTIQNISPSVTKIRIEYCPRLKNVEFPEVNGIEHFHLSDCSQFETVLDLAKLPLLKTLHLSCKFINLEKCTELEELSLEPSSDLEIIDLRLLSKLKKLKIFYNVQRLRQNRPELKELIFPQDSILEEIELRNIPGVETINLDEMQQLTSVEINNYDLTLDVGFDKLHELILPPNANFKKLYIYGNNLSISGVKNISNHKNMSRQSKIVPKASEWSLPLGDLKKFAAIGWCWDESSKVLVYNPEYAAKFLSDDRKSRLRNRTLGVLVVIAMTGAFGYKAHQLYKLKKTKV